MTLATKKIILILAIIILIPVIIFSLRFIIGGSEDTWICVNGEWIKHGAADILRGGVWDVGGITPLVKIAHLAEAFSTRMEVHGGGVGNLHVLCAMGIPGEFYERGLLHPFLDREQPPR